jgi:hypothetical protein
LRGDLGAGSHLSCNTGRAIHVKLRVLVCSPFGVTRGWSSKLSSAAIWPDVPQKSLACAMVSSRLPQLALAMTECVPLPRFST